MDWDVNALRQAFTDDPHRVFEFPHGRQQGIVDALQNDISERRHLVCVVGPEGSGKTRILRALRKTLGKGLIGLIDHPTPGAMLIDLAKSMQLDVRDPDEPLLRRRMVMLLAMVDQQKQPIVQMVNAADTLTAEDLNLLLHFFPPGHATLVFASAKPPEAWLSGCKSSAGEARVERRYEVEPWTVEETADYLRARLRAGGLSEDGFDAHTIDVIHRGSGGRPGPINERVLETTAPVEAPAPAEAKLVTPPVPASDAPSERDLAAGTESADIEDLDAARNAGSATSAAEIPQGRDERTAPKPLLKEPVGTAVAEAMPAIERRRRETVLRPIVPAHEIEYEEARLLRRTRRLRRRIRIWRSIAILTVLVLAAMLAYDGWRYFMHPGRMLLSGTSEADKEFLSEASGAAGVGPAEDSRPGFARPVPSLLHEAPAIPPHMMDVERQETDFSALNTPSPADEVEAAASTAPAEIAADPDRAPRVTAETSMKPNAGSESRALDVRDSKRERPVSRKASKPKGDRASARAPQVGTALTQAQREDVARLYAERAEYEWRNGQLQAASVTIQRGLENDPDNVRLLQMRAVLRAMSEEAQ